MMVMEDLAYDTPSWPGLSFWHFVFRRGGYTLNCSITASFSSKQSYFNRAIFGLGL